MSDASSAGATSLTDSNTTVVDNDPGPDVSKASGDWNSTSTWSTGVPTPNSTVDIQAKNTVTLDQGAATVAQLTIADKGTLDILGPSLTATGGIVDNGSIIGAGAIEGAITGDGSIFASGGALELTNAVDSQGQGIDLQIGANATLKLDSTLGQSQALLSGDYATTVTFTTKGELDLTGEGSGSSGEITRFQANVYNFGAGDAIEVAGDAATDTVSYNARTGILSVSSAHGAAVLDEIYLNGNYTNGEFSLASKNGVDTITICFFAGTRIRTPDGEVAVETLKRGDLVLTTDGLAKPVTWLGRQTISTLFADPIRVWPIRVRAGALAENVPSRDLVLSPDHALFVDGALFHAAALVNGSSITREFKAPRVFVYYHVELEDHSLVYAENAPAETFIDNVDRLAFDNWAEHEALYPLGKTVEEMPYARGKSARQVPMRLRAALAERARSLGLLAADVA